MKRPAISSTKKASSHLPPNMTAHDRARKYPEGILGRWAEVLLNVVILTILEEDIEKASLLCSEIKYCILKQSVRR